MENSIQITSSLSTSSSLYSILFSSSNLYLLVLVLIWYFSSVFTIISTKELMNRSSLPFLLCFGQFFISTLFSAIYYFYFSAFPSSTLFYVSSKTILPYNNDKSKENPINFSNFIKFLFTFPKYSYDINMLLFFISFSYALGFILTNFAFNVGKFYNILYIIYIKFNNYLF